MADKIPIKAKYTGPDPTALSEFEDGDTIPEDHLPISVTGHPSDTNNPHVVTNDQVGLGNVPNLDTTDAINHEHQHPNKPQLDLVTDGDHDIRTDNPHGVTKSQVGLGSVPDLDTTNAVNNQHIHSNKAELDLVTDGNHDARSDNPHGVTKTQVGLGNVPNLDTTDAVSNDHTHSNKTQLDLVTDGDHDVRSDNPHGVTKTQVGLGNVPNLDTTDAIANEHTHANKAQLDLVTDGDHDVRSDNPHGVTKTHVGLGDVPNLDTTGAVNNEHTHSNKAQLDLVTDGDHDVRTDNPHGVTAAQTSAVPTSEKGSANGVAELNSSGIVPASQLPTPPASGLTYLGLWNASTNTPTLGNSGSGGSQGDYYIVSVSGSTSIDGETDWNAGDWIVHNGSTWDKIDQTESVASVNSKIGIVVLHTDDLDDTGHTNKFVTQDQIDDFHDHSNKVQLDLVTDGDHDVRTDNPHGVTKTQVGLGNVPNLDTTDSVNNEHTHVNKAQLDLVTDGDHDVRTDNPHGVTTTQIGAIPTSEKGSANGVATLDSGSKVPIAQIPTRAITKFNVVANTAARIALSAQESDEAKQLDDGSHWIYDGSTWHEYPIPPPSVVTIAQIGGYDHPVYVDSTKSSKTLTVATQVFVWAETTIGNNDWIQTGTASDALSGHIMPYNGTVVGATFQCENDNTNAKTIRGYVNGVSTDLFTTTGSGGDQYQIDNTLNTDFNAGDKLRMRGASSGGTIADTVITLYIKWRV